jgi:multidrug transporter EmrE-like cation transporter
MLKNKYTWQLALFIDAVEIITCCCLMYPGLDALANSKVSAISMQLMTASGIVTFELYAVLILKEKRKVLQVLALLLCLASIVAVCF